MNKNHATLVFLLLFAFPFAHLFSQGTISGQVVDKSLGETMIGVNVFLKSDNSVGTTTDFDGNYQLKLAEGTYTLVFTYTGYSPKEIENIEVKDGEVNYQNVFFSDEEVGVTVKEVVVTGEAIRTGENVMLITMLKADQVSDRMGVREMQKLNISSADQALGKMVGTTVADGSVVVRGLGDRYSLAQLNGASIPSANPYKNAVNLDLIPTNLLANIVTTKTFTPDQPGTFTGGNVNLETKNFPEQRFLTVSLSTGYNTQSSFQENFITHDGGSTDWLGYDDGYRSESPLFSDETYDVALLKSAGTKARNNDELAAQVETLYDEVSHQMVPTETTTPLNHGIGISFGNQYDLGGPRRLGVIFSANYNRRFTHYNSTLGKYTLGGPQSETLIQEFNYRGTTSIESPTVGGMLGLSYKFNPRHVITFNTLYNHSADKSTRDYSGDFNTVNVVAPQVFTNRELYWLERSLLNNMLMGEHAFGATGDIKLEWLGSYSVASQDEPELRYFASQFDPKDEDDPTDDQYSINAPSEYDFPSHFWRSLDDTQYEFKVDLTLPILKSLSKGNKLKFGGLVSQKDRTFGETRISVQDRNAENFNGDAFEFFSSENGGVIGVDNDRNVIGNYLVNDTRPTNSYVGSQEILAGYAMVTVKPIDRLKIIAGVRVEDSQLPVTVVDSTFETGQFNVLPSVNLVYELKENMNLRGAYSNTVARPNLRELANFSAFDFQLGGFITGNPNLEITSITNVDARWEWLFNRGEIVAFSTYYKSFVNPIVLVNRGFSNSELIYENVDEATVYGIELEVRKNLGFLSPKLNNFKLGANFALIQSIVSIDSVELSRLQEVNPNASDTRTFYNQSPYVINTNLTYSHPDSKIDAALAFNIFGDRLVIIGEQGTPDVFEQARPQLDFNISKRFSDNLSVRFAAQNLLNPRYLLQSSFLGNDYVFSDFRIGRTFSMNLSYTIK
ncbi:MAG: TonB-dependent receptor [Bacteroidota bacterium]